MSNIWHSPIWWALWSSVRSFSTNAHTFLWCIWSSIMLCAWANEIYSFWEMSVRLMYLVFSDKGICMAHKFIHSKCAWVSVLLLVVNMSWHYWKYCTISTPLSVTLHVTCTPLTTGDEFPPVQNSTQAKMKPHCVHWHFAIFPAGLPSFNWMCSNMTCFHFPLPTGWH
jgi:hypothetical protein